MGSRERVQVGVNGRIFWMSLIWEARNYFISSNLRCKYSLGAIRKYIKNYAWGHTSWMSNLLRSYRGFTACKLECFVFMSFYNVSRIFRMLNIQIDPKKIFGDTVLGKGLLKSKKARRFKLLLMRFYTINPFQKKQKVGQFHQNLHFFCEKVCQKCLFSSFVPFLAWSGIWVLLSTQTREDLQVAVRRVTRNDVLLGRLWILSFKNCLWNLLKYISLR